MPKLGLDDVCAKLVSFNGITSQSRKVCEAVEKPSSQGSVSSCSSKSFPGKSGLRKYVFGRFVSFDQ